MFGIQFPFKLPDFFLIRLKPAYDRQGLDLVVRPDYSSGVLRYQQGDPTDLVYV